MVKKLFKVYVLFEQAKKEKSKAAEIGLTRFERKFYKWGLSIDQLGKVECLLVNEFWNLAQLERSMSDDERALLAQRNESALLKICALASDPANIRSGHTGGWIFWYMVDSLREFFSALNIIFPQQE